MLIIPTTLFFYAKKKNYEDEYGRVNFNKSFFSGLIWVVLCGFYSILTLTMVLWGIIEGKSSH